MTKLAGLSKRQKDILLLFLNSGEEDYLTGRDIAEAVDVSSKTVEREISCIGRLSRCPDLLESKRGYGYRLKKCYRQEIREELLQQKKNYSGKQLLVIPQMQSERVEWILIYLAEKTFEDQVFQMESIAEELFISLSTLKKDMNLVRNELEKYGITIAKQGKNGSVLNGDEEALRRYLGAYLGKAFAHDDLYKIYCGDADEYRRLCDLVLEILDEYQVRVTDMGFRNLILNLIVAEHRMEQNPLGGMGQMESIASDSREYKAARAICERILKPHIHADTIPESELNWIYYYLISRHRQSAHGKNVRISEKSPRYAGIEECLCETFKELRSFYSLDIQEKEFIEDVFVTHIDAALNRIEYGMSVKNEMLDEIKQNFPFEMQLSLILSEKLDHRFRIRLNEDEVAFLAMYFGALLESSSTLNQERTIRVLFVCTGFSASVTLLEARLKHRLGTRLEVLGTCSVLEWVETQPESWGRIDFILTDVRELDSKGIASIVYSTGVSNSEADFICRKLSDEQQISIRELLNKNLFLYSGSIGNKEQVLDKLAGLIRRYGLADEKCIESIYQREKMGATQIGNLVAIPHNISGTVFKSSILVIVLQNPVLWNEDSVQLVVLIITDSQKNRYRKLLESLYEKINTQGKVRKIVEQHTFHYFYSLFNDMDMS